MGSIKTVGIIGAGQMGAGIAQVSATSGYSTILWDSNPAALDRAITSIKNGIEKIASKGVISTEEAKSAATRIKKASGFADFAECDLAIEAIIEQFEPKVAVFKELDKALPGTAIIASNTSSISITRMAAATQTPERFMGVHFMNPVPIMQLVELIRALQTSDSTFAAVEEYCRTIKKTTVLAIDTPGFIVNRILCPMINEAIFLLQEGVKAVDIDSAMKLGTNQPMGPLTLADFVGLDTLLYIMQVLHAELGEDKYRPCPLLIKYVEAGWFGKKSGRGFYTYK